MLGDKCSLQQFTLALNICEVMMALHRQYYVHALHEPVADPTLSVYGQSYLTIVERCNVSCQHLILADMSR